MYIYMYIYIYIRIYCRYGWNLDSWPRAMRKNLAVVEGNGCRFNGKDGKVEF